MLGLDLFAAALVCDGAGKLQDPIVRAELPRPPGASLHASEQHQYGGHVIGFSSPMRVIHARLRKNHADLGQLLVGHVKFDRGGLEGF